jgi:phosphoribosylanthranilate isomerase
MAAKVKICGLTTEAALDAALVGGAAYVGLVFFPPSPRNISVAAGAALAAKARGRAKVVTLLVDPDEGLIAEVVAAVDPDMLQLHGDESPQRVRDVRLAYARPVMKAINVATASDAQLALAYRDVADLILFDARPPAAATRPGGHGAAFDWHVLDGVKDQVSYMLSGGLTPDNVAGAIRITGAPAVDVSSGVESAPGEKNPELIRRFLRAAKGV